MLKRRPHQQPCVTNTDNLLYFQTLEAQDGNLHLYYNLSCLYRRLYSSTVPLTRISSHVDQRNL
jgi:hypothetical protein